MTNNIWLRICCLSSFDCLPIQKSIRMTDGQQLTLPGFGSRWDETPSSVASVGCWRKHERRAVWKWSHTSFPQSDSYLIISTEAAPALNAALMHQLHSADALACCLQYLRSVAFFESAWNVCKRLCCRTRLKSTLKRTKDSPDFFSSFTLILETVDLIDCRGKESRCKGFRVFSMSGIGNLLPWRGPSFMAINFLRLGTKSKFPLLRKCMPEHTLTRSQAHTFIHIACVWKHLLWGSRYVCGAHRCHK